MRVVMAAFLTLWFALYIFLDVRAHYQYNNQLGAYWNLSVKSSTLEAKSEYLNRFVAAVDSAELSGYNALVFQTPDNSYKQNRAVLGTLQQRMEEIRGMDVKSFEYQQAISQITAQEQDEAGAVLGVVQGIWFLNHHFFMWDWVEVVVIVAFLAVVCVAWGAVVLDTE